MKKFISLLLALAMTLSLCACGSSFKEITLPATFFEDETEESIKAEAEEKGFSECTVNEDGSVTYKMSKTMHKELLSEMRASLDESIDSLINGEEAVASFIKIDHADDFSQFDIFVDPETYTTWDGIYALVFYISGAYYQIFDGKDADTVDVLVNFIDNNTKETISSSSNQELLNAGTAG